MFICFVNCNVNCPIFQQSSSRLGFFRPKREATWRKEGEGRGGARRSVARWDGRGGRERSNGATRFPARTLPALALCHEVVIFFVYPAVVINSWFFDIFCQLSLLKTKMFRHSSQPIQLLLIQRSQRNLMSNIVLILLNLMTIIGELEKLD